MRRSGRSFFPLEAREAARWLPLASAAVTLLAMATAMIALAGALLGFARPAHAGDGLDLPWQMWAEAKPPEVEDEPFDTALTEALLWAPDGSSQFKTAASCHLPEYDYYVVFAAFTVEQPDGSTADELWYLLVDGLSSYSMYGEIVLDAHVATEDVITQVACAGDGHTTSFVAWDRSDDSFDTDDLLWARVSLWGSATVHDTVGDCNGHTSWAPGIAYSDDPEMGDVVAISSAPRADCNHCWSIHDASSGARLGHGDDFASAIGTTTRATAITDSGDGGWLMAWLAWVDGDDSGHPAAIFARRIDRDGSFAWGDLTPIWDSGSHDYPAAPDHIDLVPPGDDDDGRFLIQTFVRTAWVRGNAQMVETSPFWPYNPTADGEWEHAVACPYAGDEIHHLATSFRETDDGRSGRRHWFRTPWPASDRGDVDEIIRVPVDCAATADVADPEVLLVRAYDKASSPAADYLYLNLFPAD